MSMPALSLKDRATLVIANPLARDTAFIALNSVLNGVGGLLFWFVATHRYTPNLVGVASAGTSIVVFLAAISQLGLNVGIVRYGPSFGKARTTWLSIIFATVAVTSVLVGLAFWRLAPVVASGLDPIFSTRSGTLWFIGSCLLWALSVLNDHNLISQRYNGILVIKGIAAALIRVALILVYHNLSAAVLIGITGVSGGVGIIVALLLTRRHGHRGVGESAVSVQELIGYSFWNYVSLLAAQSPALVLPSILVSRIGGAQSAAFYLAWMLFSILLLVPGALSWAVLTDKTSVSGNAYRGSRSHRVANRGLLLITILFVPLALLVLFALGQSYLRDGWSVILVLSAGSWPYCQANIYLAELRYHGSQRVVAVSYTVTQTLVVALAIPLLMTFGITGAAIAWTLGQGLLSIWLGSSARKSQRNVQRG